jgi:hypothetical protein
VKKCTSCAKDLPDSAHHCVFCGAKQAPAPVPGAAAQQARTVLGYQAADVVKEMQRQGHPGQRPGGGSQPPPMGSQPPMGRSGHPSSQPPPGQPYPPPGQPYQPPPGQPYQPPPMQQAYQPPPPMQQAYQPPPAASQAKTVFIPGGAGPGPMPVQSAPIPLPRESPSAPVHAPIGTAPSAPVHAPMIGAPMHGAPMHGAPVAMPQLHAPSGPTSAPPYLASQTAARAARPIEPFTDGLKLVMLSFGILLLGAFATPVTTEPMAFHWNTIIDGEGMAKLFPLMLAATGVLALVMALIPLGAAARGAIAAALGVFIVSTPIIAAGDIGAWQVLVALLATPLVVVGLLLRNEYREASLGRILTTIGAVGVLALYLIPVGGGNVPLADNFTAIIDSELAEQKIGAIINLLPAVLAIVSLLCWLPAPGSAGAKVIAWMWIVFPAFDAVSGMLIRSGGDVGGIIQASPFAALMIWVPATAAIAFIGYGLASVLGKQLE